MWLMAKLAELGEDDVKVGWSDDEAESVADGPKRYYKGAWRPGGRGSVFEVLAVAKEQPDANGKWLTRLRRIGMALDAAKEMARMHGCTPPVFHMFLRSSCLLADEGWNAQVEDSSK
eukprot:evm.model.scf_4176.1 EVM.evm.TU.scf_4176.1   scf_4176:1825-2424(+)